MSFKIDGFYHVIGQKENGCGLEQPGRREPTEASRRESRPFSYFEILLSQRLFITIPLCL